MYEIIIVVLLVVTAILGFICGLSKLQDYVEHEMTPEQQREFGEAMNKVLTHPYFNLNQY